MINWDLWYRLGTRSRRAVRRSYTRHGQKYDYRPRGTLLERLARETGSTKEQVYRELAELHREMKEAQL